MSYLRICFRESNIGSTVKQTIPLLKLCSYHFLLCFSVQVGEPIGDNTSSVLDFLSMKPYSDVSLDISMLSSLGRCFH